MALVETVAVSLGPAVAKGIIKVWLKDRSIATELGSQVVDLLKSTISDALGRQRAARQFEAMGQQVAETLIPIFEIEGARIPEGSRAAVAFAVAESLTSTSVNSQLIVDASVDAEKFAKLLKETECKSAIGLSDTELALRGRILDEVARNIVDVADSLPAFDQRVYAEILRRESELLRLTDEVLSELRQLRIISEQAFSSGSDPQFENDYRRTVVRKLDLLQLFGIQAKIKQQKLRVAYISLSVRTSSTEGLVTGSQSSSKGSAVESEDVDLISVEQLLGKASRILVRGLAGSGKTTLLQWIAVRSATNSFPAELASWNDSIPFFLRLREYVEERLPAPEDFARFVAPLIAPNAPKNWAYSHLKAGRAIILVDGLDEVPSAMRMKVRDWLKDLIDTFPHSRFVITSRPSAIEEGWLSGQQYLDAELQPMEVSAIFALIDHWHNAAMEDTIDEDEQIELNGLADHLKQEVRNTRALRALMETPLICAMLCALHRDRKQTLPSDRLELYRACTEAFVERRDLERGIRLQDYPKWPCVISAH